MQSVLYCLHWRTRGGYFAKAASFFTQLNCLGGQGEKKKKKGATGWEEMTFLSKKGLSSVTV